VSALAPGPLRRALDGLYLGSGALAAVCLAATCVVMLAQVVGREAGYLFRGADDIAAWLCAAAAFLALAHTFRRGELVRMMLLVEHLSTSARWRAEVLALLVATVFSGFMLWSVVRFVYASWQFKEVAQGLIKVPIWIPQLSFALGVLVFFIAVVDELVAVLRGQTPAYRLAEEERLARGDFSETL
jgi:TRAP-type C4-dicarboxylate transport system permease small subunit